MQKSRAMRQFQDGLLQSLLAVGLALVSAVSGCSQQTSEPREAVDTSVEQSAAGASPKAGENDHQETIAAPSITTRLDPNAPPGMVWIPGGEFLMGSEDDLSRMNERPAHRVRVAGFWMDVTPVTNAQFREFVEATGYVTVAERAPDWEELKKQLPPGTPKPDPSLLVPGSMVFVGSDGPVDLRQMANFWKWTAGASWRHPQGPGSDINGRGQYPVVQVAWDDAVAYAEWAGKRLPTEAEWEFAARGGLEGRRFSWGDELRPNGKHMVNTWTGDFPYRNTREDGFEGVAPVRSFPANGYGLYGMAGNVWNWCADYYRPDTYQQRRDEEICLMPTGPRPDLGPASPATQSNWFERVVKGGSFLCHPDYCASYRPSARRGLPHDTGMSHVSFRCVKSTQ